MLQHQRASCSKFYIPPTPERSGLLLFVPVAGLEIATYLLYILQRMRRGYYLLAEK